MSGVVLMAPVLSTAIVTPEPWLICWACRMCSLASHHSDCRGVSADAVPLPTATMAAASATATGAIEGRGNLTGTPALPSVRVNRILPRTGFFGTVCADVGKGAEFAACASGRPGRGEPHVRARGQAQLLGRVARVDGQRDQAGTVGVGDDLARCDRRERLHV